MPDTPRCDATSKRSGERCKRAPAVGLTKCSMHAGLSKEERQRTAAEHRAMQKASATLARLDVEPVTNSLEELQWLAAVAHAWIEQIAAMVNELERRVRYEGRLRGEQLRGEVALLERAMDRCLAVNSSIVRLGIDHRLTTIKETDARNVADALAAVLTELDLDPSQSRAARQSFARRLRTLGATREAERTRRLQIIQGTPA